MKNINHCFRVAIFILLTVSLAACVSGQSTQTPGLKFSEAAVVSVQDPNAAIEQGASFAWLPSAIKFYQDKRLADAPVKSMIEREIVRNLQLKGMQVVKSLSQAGYAIAYTAALESSLDDSAIIRQFGLLPGNASIPEGDASIEKGSLVVYAFDNASHKIIWRAAAQVGVKFDTPMEERQKRITQVIGEMFLTFPVVAKKQ